MQRRKPTDNLTDDCSSNDTSAFLDSKPTTQSFSRTRMAPRGSTCWQILNARTGNLLIAAYNITSNTVIIGMQLMRMRESQSSTQETLIMTTCPRTAMQERRKRGDDAKNDFICWEKTSRAGDTDITHIYKPTGMVLSYSLSTNDRVYVIREVGHGFYGGSSGGLPFSGKKVPVDAMSIYDQALFKGVKSEKKIEERGGRLGLFCKTRVIFHNGEVQVLPLKGTTYVGTTHVIQAHKKKRIFPGTRAEGHYNVDWDSSSHALVTSHFVSGAADLAFSTVVDLGINKLFPIKVEKNEMGDSHYKVSDKSNAKEVLHSTRMVTPCPFIAICRSVLFDEKNQPYATIQHSRMKLWPNIVTGVQVYGNSESRLSQVNVSLCTPGLSRLGSFEAHRALNGSLYLVTSITYKDETYGSYEKLCEAYAQTDNNDIEKIKRECDKNASRLTMFCQSLQSGNILNIGEHKVPFHPYNVSGGNMGKVMGEIIQNRELCYEYTTQLMKMLADVLIVGLTRATSHTSSELELIKELQQNYENGVKLYHIIRTNNDFKSIIQNVTTTKGRLDSDDKYRWRIGIATIEQYPSLISGMEAFDIKRQKSTQLYLGR